MNIIKEGIRFLPGILFSLFWFGGTNISPNNPPKEATPVTFTFTLPSLAEQIDLAGEFDPYNPEPVQGLPSPDLTFYSLRKAALPNELAKGKDSPESWVANLWLIFDDSPDPRSREPPLILSKRE